MPASVAWLKRQRRGLGRLDLAARKARERLAQRLGRDLAADAGNADQLRAGGEELGRAAFVVDDVRLLVAERRLPRAGQRGERERVGGGAGGDEKSRDLALEQLGTAAPRRAPCIRRRRRRAR